VCEWWGVGEWEGVGEAWEGVEELRRLLFEGGRESWNFFFFIVYTSERVHFFFFLFLFILQ